MLYLVHPFVAGGRLLNERRQHRRDEAQGGSREHGQADSLLTSRVPPISGKRRRQGQAGPRRFQVTLLVSKEGSSRESEF